ncbi:DUF309 domain-containing protein [Halococcus saccharolyticus]|uniref:DUF309 domain-containing protein n=1 Tax=Halococcus saccharolyticus DSM 5350 TaxID=1227455 RepID=M0MIA7_9EURY|nr:DUF309 domain-containing protein [Halococcus saccharolyticus]EMA44175.1 hypothetical protein C449_11633 [Halococcus saccharolyticus DSM 5350]
MDAHLQAGIAIYNAGRFHAAHDAWEDRWLALDTGDDDERFLHGLIQFTAAVHHATGRNWTGACGLAESAREYLADLPEDYRGVNVGEVREYLAVLDADPESIERGPPLTVAHEGRQLGLDDLDFEASAVAAEVLAEAGDADHATIERAVEYARDDFAAGNETSPFVTLVMDFVRDSDNRGIVRQRLTEHTERRAARDRDVDGLFDP